MTLKYQQKQYRSEIDYYTEQEFKQLRKKSKKLNQKKDYKGKLVK